MSNADAIKRLRRTFGHALDEDTLAAVLEVCDGDVKAAEQFLQAENDTSGYDANQLHLIEGGIPQDYPKREFFVNDRRRGAAPVHQQPTEGVKKTETEEEKIKSLFISENVSLQDHFDAQTNQHELYASVLILLMHQGVEISKGSRARILASCWARKDKVLPQFLLKKEELFGLPHVLGALNLLDAPRKIRAIEKKVARLEKQGTVKPKKLGQLRSSINDLKRETHIGSVSGALSKEIRKWAGQIPKENLEYFALNMPKGPWTELADMIHFNPQDFQCKWFLEFTFGKEPPSDSIVPLCKTITPENVVQIISECPVPYSYLRLHVKPLPQEAKVVVAKYTPLNTVIWYYEELACPEVDAVIDERLDKEKPSFGYGKLMERMLYFKSENAPFFRKLMPIAEDRLRSIDLKLESPVVILGDASNSMDVAIRVSTVISSVIAAVSGAELKFFTGVSVDPPVIPRNVPEVLEVASKMKADGLTAPAAGLWPYYAQKKIVKFFIVVTDEVENEKYNNYFFPSLFEKYYKEVYPAKIVFVSFLENPSEKGRMVSALEAMGIVPLQFKLDGRRPDMTKLDSLLGLLASESNTFPEQVQDARAIFKETGLEGLVNTLASRKRKVEEVTGREGKEEDEVKEEMKEEAKEETKEEMKEETKEEMKEEVKENNNNTTPTEDKCCVICEERSADTALVECGHLSFCQTCAEPLKECPICRAPVLRVIRIYQNA